MSQTEKISGPVGRSAMNHPKDVVVVQKLLNGHFERDPCRRQLRVDGRWSQELERAIEAFQLLTGDQVMIKGRVAPATRMFELLKQPPAIFGYERRMAQRMRVEPVQQASTIEVLIFDGRLISTGSQWGHAAIDLDGKVYSQSHSRYAVLERSGYLSSNLEYRDAVGLTLRVSLAEKAKIKSELDSRVAAQKPYSLTDNSCSTNVAEVLEIAGILAHDPRFQMVPSSSRMVSPKELLIAISRSDRVLKRDNYKKGS